MNTWIVLISLYVLSIIALIVIDMSLRKKYAIITYGYAIRCVTVATFIPANLVAATSIFKALIADWLVPNDGKYVIILEHVGYLRIMYFVAISVLAFSLLLLCEREIVSFVVHVVWKYSYHDDIEKNIELLERMKNEYPHNSERYAETICKLSDLYYAFAKKARKAGENALAEEYEQKRMELKNMDRIIIS